MRNLVEHAKVELDLMNEEPATIEGYLKVLQAFADMSNSGRSAMVAIPVITQLLQFKNLMPLTDDPSEWYFHGKDTWGGESGSVWQNKRNSEALSNDEGKTYYLLSEGASDSNREPMHESAPMITKEINNASE